MKSSTCRSTLMERLVVIGVIAILGAMLLPVLGNAREKSRQTVCASNLNQLGLASHMYANDFDGWLRDDNTVQEFLPTEFPHGNPNDPNIFGANWNLNGHFWFTTDTLPQAQPWTSGFAVHYMYGAGSYEAHHTTSTLYGYPYSGPVQSQLRDRSEDDSSLLLTPV